MSLRFIPYCEARSAFPLSKVPRSILSTKDAKVDVRDSHDTDLALETSSGEHESVVCMYEFDELRGEKDARFSGNKNEKEQSIS